MRMSQAFIRTLREIPAEADTPGHHLLLRAGFIRQLAAGIFCYLPLARRTLDKIETILREELLAIGGQEITMPVIHPAELWKESGRWYQIDAELGRFKDRAKRDMVLAIRHEEVIADLVRREVRSYRQLPKLLFHIQTKWHDDPRPRAGLIRAREFTMIDSYSLDADWNGLDLQYRRHYQAYFNIFHRCGLDVTAVSADVGMMGGIQAHEFVIFSPIGEDTIILCDSCGYKANRQVARFQKQIPSAENPLPLEKVATPDCPSIEALAHFLAIPKSKTAKAVFLMAEEHSEESSTPIEQFIFAVIRGDMEVNETKLAHAVNARSLRPATEEEIRKVGAEPGYASPIGLNRSQSLLPFQVIVDDLIPSCANLVAGANQPGFHMINVNYGRDFQADLITDIASARQGDSCPHCGSVLQAARGIEVGNIIKLGTSYSQKMGCTFQDENGHEKPVLMGSYGIGVGRLMGSIAEIYHDEKGLTWPISVAPYQIYLISLVGKSTKDSQTLNSIQVAEELYDKLTLAGFEVLFDDRDESPGVKFNDADLIGLPLRITVGEKSLRQGCVELKLRTSDERSLIPLQELPDRLRQEIQILNSEIYRRVKLVEYSQNE